MLWPTDTCFQRCPGIQLLEQVPTDRRRRVSTSFATRQPSYGATPARPVWRPEAEQPRRPSRRHPRVRLRAPPSERRHVRRRPPPQAPPEPLPRLGRSCAARRRDVGDTGPRPGRPDEPRPVDLRPGRSRARLERAADHPRQGLTRAPDQAARGRERRGQARRHRLPRAEAAASRPDRRARTLSSARYPDGEGSRMAPGSVGDMACLRRPGGEGRTAPRDLRPDRRGGGPDRLSPADTGGASPRDGHRAPSGC